MKKIREINNGSAISLLRVLNARIILENMQRSNTPVKIDKFDAVFPIWMLFSARVTIPIYNENYLFAGGDNEARIIGE